MATGDESRDDGNANALKNTPNVTAVDPVVATERAVVQEMERDADGC